MSVTEESYELLAPETAAAYIAERYEQIRRDACAFAAAEAARQVVGLAHVGDLETLEDDAKAAASRGVIRSVERLLLERFESAEAVAAMAVEETA